MPPIEAEGGEVLKFMGDGLLAIFRIADDAPVGGACARALRRGATGEGQNRGAARRQRRGERSAAALRACPACRRGAYGNIGGGGRLDFTCIGPAVNMAARIEKLASKLGRAILGSSAFARHLPDEFVPLGDFELAGFREPRRYTACATRQGQWDVKEERNGRKIFEQFEVGQTFVHEIRRTVTDMDNILFSALTHNPAAIHIDHEYGQDHRVRPSADQFLGYGDLRPSARKLASFSAFASLRFIHDW